MIQDETAGLKALPEDLELSRARKGIIVVAEMCTKVRAKGALTAMKWQNLHANFGFSLSRRLILGCFAAALLLLPVRQAAAQGAPAGPLPAAAPADQPPAAAPAKTRGPATIGGKPNLSGAWILNKDQSDDPRQKMQQAANSNGQGGGNRGTWGGGGGMGGGGWGGMGGGQHGGMGGGRGQGSGQSGSERGDMMTDMSQISIEQTETTAKVSDESGRTLASYSSADSSHEDASKNSTSGSSTGSSSGSQGSSSSASASKTPRVQWKGEQLVAVEQGEHGRTTTRTYELSPDGTQLYVTTKIESPRFKNPVTIQFVYDPAPSGG